MAMLDNDRENNKISITKKKVNHREITDMRTEISQQNYKSLKEKEPGTGGYKERERNTGIQ
jgi:hypothetical protein